MRVLIVGAGAIGGYFGGRMLQAGRDITFLVRPRRASELAAAGLVIKSPNGDVTLKNPPVVQADSIKDKFDAVLLSCKAYDLDDAVKSFAPAVGERDRDHPAAQRYASSGRSRQNIWRELRCPCRKFRPLGVRGPNRAMNSGCSSS